MSDHDHNHETCRQLLSSLGDYIDGSLSQELCLEIEKHMRDCKRCTVVVNTLKKTVELYQHTAQEEKLPEQVRQRLYLKLDLDEFYKSM